MNGFPIREARQKYSDLKQISDLSSWQEEERQKIFNFHSANNDFYFHKVLGGNKHYSWSQIPILTKVDLRGDYVSKIPSGVRQQKLYLGSTSGSSGQPLVFARDAMHHALVWINVESHYNKSGVSVSDMEARFYGIPLSGKGYYKEKIKDFLAHRRRFVVYDLNDDVLAGWVTRFERHRFQFMYGYTNSLVAFAKFLERRTVRLKDVCPSLKACIVTSEMCSPAERAFLTAAFGVHVANEYGASEVSVIGYKTEDHWECSDELLYLEVVDSQGKIVPDGRAGRLLCTCLHNLATPIIRYEIGDLATLERSNGKTKITSLEGRLNDMAILPSGKKVPGFTFYYVASEIVQTLDGVKEYRVVQCEPEKFYVEIVGDVFLSTTDYDNLRRVFDRYLEPGLSVSYKRVNEIKREGNGKFKHFISEV